MTIKTPEQTLRDLLNDGGLLGSWTHGDGSTQPQPVLQVEELDEEAVSSNDRILLIRNVGGGGGDYQVTSPLVELTVLSKAARTDGRAARYYLELINGIPARSV